jgi:hypothetical protein
VWEDLRNGLQRVWVRTSDDDTRGFPISDIDEGEASFPAIAVNDHGAAVVYETTMQGNRSIQFRWLDKP